MNKNKKYIVTSGKAYIDIDVLACSISYSDLLKLLGFNETHVVLTGPLNGTISQTILGWNIPIEKIPPTKPNNYFYILVDISNPDYFESFVSLDKVVKIFDHHYGFENYWKNRIGKMNSYIEKIGSCATLIWEQYKSFGVANKISNINANLLFTSIISNTLNLQAKMTTGRDIQSIKELNGFTNLPNNWKESYYSEIENKILQDVKSAISKDKKQLKINCQNYVIGQIELWNAQKLMKKKELIQIIKKSLEINNNKDIKWFMNIPSISEGINYIITQHDEMKSELKKMLDITFISKDLGFTSSLWLRKEIIKKLIDIK